MAGSSVKLGKLALKSRGSIIICGVSTKRQIKKAIIKNAIIKKYC